MQDALQAIQDFTDVLTVAGVEHWLFGGWAIDFHVGRNTRQHNDIDMIVWNHDTPRIIVLLQQHAFELRATAAEHVYFEKHQQRIEISFIEHNSSGEIITPGQWAEWPWPTHAFMAGTRSLHGVCCPVTSLESVIETKQAFQFHAPDQPLREKDRADLRVYSLLTNA